MGRDSGSHPALIANGDPAVQNAPLSPHGANVVFPWPAVACCVCFRGKPPWATNSLGH